MYFFFLQPTNNNAKMIQNAWIQLIDCHNGQHWLWIDIEINPKNHITSTLRVFFLLVSAYVFFFN